MDYTRYLNEVSLARQPAIISALSDILQTGPPSMISLHRGEPNTEMIPFESAEIQLKDGSSLSFDDALLTTALGTGPFRGHPLFTDQLWQILARYHNPPPIDATDEKGGGRDICVTIGSQDALCKVFEMLVSRGDNVLVDRPTYASALAILRPLGCNIVGIETDHQGMITAALRQTLSRWKLADSKDPKSTIPRILYSIPNGVNPTGASLTLARKREIYQIAREYGILILEDDPYYFLQFCHPRIPTFMSMDVDGRVLRLDSFSKIMASGLRVGYVTGPKRLVNGVVMHMMASTLAAPFLAQMMISQLLQKWGPQGMEQHVLRVRDFYKERKDSIMKSAERWLSGLAEWNEPTAGLFLWIKLKGITDSKKLIMSKALEKDVMLMPGCAFMPDDEAPCPYTRASYSRASPEDMDKAMERLASLIKDATGE